jgi:hypothetical protein
VVKELATTALTVFEYTMALLDEIQDNGQISTQNTQNYKAKTPKLITILENDLCRKEGILNPTPITDINDELNVSDDVALRILPYGLASVLLLIEDPATASFYNQRYEELKRQIPSAFTTIDNVYADWSVD